MKYIYHMVPSEMRGTILYPLNTLKEMYPNVYLEYIKKYERRERLLEATVPLLNCLWNDVLHCSALSPDVIIDEFKKLGKNFSLSYFEIPADMLEPEKTVVYLYNPREKGTPAPESDFVPYNPTEVEKYAYLPEATKEYFKNILEEGGRPLMFHLVPHILYKGSIETRNLKVISV